jgi:DNA repair protein RecN (Recombination protein N)
MLERLVIRDLAVVERADIRLEPGLNALTGETGAGKSLLVQAANLLLGGRADSDTVREGADAAIVEGTFRLAGDSARRVVALLAEWGIEDGDGTVIVRREVRRDGRSRALVNQASVTLASLRALGEGLADLHGQHEHQSLLRADAGTLVLDRLAALEEERARFEARVAGWRDARDAHDRLTASLATVGERGDWLRHAANELDEASPRAGEDEELARDAARLAHADRLRELVGGAIERLSEGDTPALGQLSAAMHALEQAAALDPGLADTLPALREAEIAAAEAARALSGYVDGLEADPQALETIEARRDLLARLQRKYRRDLAGLAAWRDEIARELDAAEDAEGALARSQAAVDAAEADARAAGLALSERRREAGELWGPKLAKELRPLGMPAARFEFVLEPSAPEAAADTERLGVPPVAMRFSANPGEPARPLQRIASGGELSRVMLALKAVMESRDRVDLLFFDEVDSGIGGAVAQAVGERLRRLARHRQIVCVTHLPLIAALATHHLRVAKQVTGGRTVARIEPVDGEARVAELARMLAGDRVTETTRRQARELLATR